MLTNIILAVDDTDGKPKDTVLKTIYQELLSFNQHFIKTLEILNKYLNSRRNTKREFAAKNFACIMSQKLYHKNITEALLEGINAYLTISKVLKLNKAELTNVESDK